jgi:tRNA (guanine-N7-)-methyltransferase
MLKHSYETTRPLTMGRRALRKVDSSLDLSGHLKMLDQLPRPCTAETLFGRAASLEVEVGSGKGLFLRNAAAARPDVDFLGIEVARKYAAFAAAGLVKGGLTNAVVVCGDGLRLFSELIPDNTLAAVHVYFPDPWWKKRHRRRRVMRDSFLHDIARTLQPGGSLHFWTDVEEYFRTSLELLAECTPLQGPLPVPEIPAEHDMAYRTHFERRVRLASEPVYRAEFKKGEESEQGEMRLPGR